MLAVAWWGWCGALDLLESSSTDSCSGGFSEVTENLQLPLTSSSAVNLLIFSPPKYLTPYSWCCYNSCICKGTLDPKAASSGGSLGVPTGPLLPALEHIALPGPGFHLPSLVITA